MSLKIIGAGFGRTGTLSLKSALEYLGFNKCHHMVEVGRSRRLSNQWYAIAKGARPDWDEVFNGYQASCDFPASVYWEELHNYYPDSKVILTLRDADEWYESVARTIYPLTTNIPPWVRWLVPGLRKNHHTINTLIWDQLFDGSFENKAHAISVYGTHAENVIRNVDSDRLLVFDAKQGWDPLCEFLKVPVPTIDFPHLNKSATLQHPFRALQLLKWKPLEA